MIQRSFQLLPLLLVCLAGNLYGQNTQDRESNQPVSIRKNAEEQWNLLVIMTDEHNFRTLGCYRETMEDRQAYMWGDAVVETPNIDWLANQGALFTSYYATTPVCSPCRGSFISGMYPQKTPVVKNNIPLDDGVITFAEVLRRKGYATGYAGKWHLDGDGKPQWAPERKFGFEDNRYMFNRGHWKKLELTEEGPRVGAKNEGQPSYSVDDADEETFTTDFLVNRTIEFIDEHKAGPFCYMLSLPDPHGPDTVRAPYDTMFKDQTYERPESAKKDDASAPAWGKKQKGQFGQAAYYGMVKCIDDNIGRIIEKLRSEGLLEKTIIVFTSDHGDLRGEHHRQNKGVPYEGSTRVPFLLYAPGKVPAQTRVDEAMGSVDFMPSALSLMEIEYDQPLDGRDFSPLLDPSNDEVAWDDIAFIRGTGDKRGWLMAASDRYKLVYSSSDEPWLFDLERDPDEVLNQFTNAAYREVIQQMSTKLMAYSEEHSEPFMADKTMVRDIEWAINGKGEYPGRSDK